ncbi:glycoside hydrolase family 66 protein [Paenibacillus sp. KR2-11]|uniref:glycoside hydrolase family 66 protein n=1 Tax=Paenibacillus sp. KR2-11 TaxID=3385500 RepID=UPI0038FD1ED4
MKNTKRKMISQAAAAVLLVQSALVPAAALAAQPQSEQTVTLSALAGDTAAVPAAPISKVTVGKARYAPGEEVQFTIGFDQSQDWSGKLIVEFYSAEKLMGAVSRTVTVLRSQDSTLTVNWQPPADDFRGYLVKAYIEGKPQAFQTSALDVSSDWTHFPRYGYTTEFPKETSAESEAKIKQLSQDYFLNGYQFYDWMWRHDVSVYSETYKDGDGRVKPVRDAQGNFVTAPVDENTSYLDLLGRPIYPQAVKQQIEASQKYGSAAMAYQMNYAAREHYEDYGVKKEWGLYNKNTQFPNPDPIKYQNGFYFDWVNTGLYMQDPGHPGWQAYINKEYNRSVNDFKFDGIHLDQWGANDNDFLYSYDGQERYYSKDYDSLINSVKDSLVQNDPTKSHVTFNMVGGSQEYADVPSPGTKTDFDYSEIWTNRDNYQDVKGVIEDTQSKNGGKAMVIAGYMNYKQAAGDNYAVSNVEGLPKTVEFQSRINSIAGWVGDFGIKNEDKIVWTVQADAAGTYDLTLKYGHANAGGSPDGRVTVNGTEAVSSILFDENTGWGNPRAQKTIKADLKAGSNQIVLQLNSTGLWLNVDSLEVAGQGGVKEYEAEYAELVSCRVDRFGNVFFFETDGDYITFDVQAPADGSYPVSVSYGIAAAAVQRDVLVNDELVSQGASFPATGGWETFKNSKPMTLPLKAGTNKVTLRVGGAPDTGMNVNYLQVGDTRYEAEKALFGWKPSREAQIQVHPGVMDASYVKNLNRAPDSIEFDVVSGTAGMQEIVFQYASQNTPKAAVTVNGTQLPEEVTFTPTGGWEGEAGNTYWSWKKILVPVNAGTNQVKLSLTTNGQYLNLDGILTGSEMILVNDQRAVNGTPRVKLNGGVKVNASTDAEAKTDDFNGAAGNSVTFQVYAAAEGDYNLGLWYRTGNAQTAPLTIDGTDTQISLPANNWYDGWWGMVEQTVHLTPGYHSVNVRSENANTWLNLHALSAGRKLESEAPETRTHGVEKTAQSTAGFGDSGDFIQLNVNRTDAGHAPLHIAYRSNAALEYTLQVNGVSQNIMFSNTSNTWSQMSVPVSFAAGTNVLRLFQKSSSDESIVIDNLTLDEVVTEAEAPSVVRGGSAVVETKWSTVGYIDSFGQKGDSLTLELSAITGNQTHDLVVNYRNPGEVSKRAIYLNGKKLGTFEFGASSDWTKLTIPDVYVPGGQLTHSLMIQMEQATEAGSGLAIDSFEMGNVTFEAESGKTVWQPVVAKTGSITTELGRTDNHGLVGQKVTFQVNAAEAVEQVIFRYRTDNNPKFDLFVDGVQAADDVTFGQTPGGWSGGMAERSLAAALTPGEHTLELVVASDRQYINLDSVVVGDREYEAEAAVFSGGAEGVRFTQGFASGFDDENDFLHFEVKLNEAGAQDLTWTYRNNAVSGQDAVRNLYVNGQRVEELAFVNGADWSTLVTPGVQLQQGSNIITLQLDGHDDYGIDLDYLQVGSIRIDGEKADATPAMTLYKDLLLNFGHAGDEVTFDVDIEQAGETSLIFTYANAGAVASKDLYIDGEKVTELGFRSTGSRTTFDEDIYYIVPYLAAGKHKVTLKHGEDSHGTIDLRSMTIGFFNEPSVRLMDAVLGAFGATHIELGTAESFEEGPNMLAHEYYPNRSKKMKTSLKESLKDYYKFYAAYENLLFDSVEDKNAIISVTDAEGQTVTTSKDGKEDALLAVARKTKGKAGFGSYDVLNFVNLLGNDSNWRNAAAEPVHAEKLKVAYEVGVTQSQAPNLKVFGASPDRAGGMFEVLPYTWDGTKIVFEMPTLEYWNMVFVSKAPTGTAPDSGGTDPGTDTDGTDPGTDTDGTDPGSDTGGSDSGSDNDTEPGTGTGSSGSPVPSTPAKPGAEVAVSLASITKDGSSVVKLKKDENTVRLPLNADELVGTGSVELVKEGVKLILPAELFKQLRTLSKTPGDGITIHVGEVSTAAKDAALAILKGVMGLTAIQAGGVMQFEIGLQNGQAFKKLDAPFEQPVQLEIGIERNDVDEELIGLYYYNELAKNWEYAGGKYDEAARVLTVPLHHFSTYAPLIWKQGFQDVGALHWAHRPIEVLASRQVVQGRSNNSFEPNGTTTRAEFVTMLARAFGLKAQTAAGFQDVAADTWYADAVAAAGQQGWVTGRTSELFMPHAPITREEMAVIVSRVLHSTPGHKEHDSHRVSLEFADSGSISDWAAKAVRAVTEAGLMEGREDGMFAPQKRSMRAEVSAVIYRLLQQSKM